MISSPMRRYRRISRMADACFSVKKDLEKIKKNYGFDRKTELTNAKAAVVKALPIEEKEVVFVMDRFGYSKILDKNTYERNEETVLKEYRHIVHCMNTDKICVFTYTGVMHQIKVQDIPSGRLRDKGTPLDNIGNYDSRNEQILLIVPDRTLKESSLLFVTASSMISSPMRRYRRISRMADACFSVKQSLDASFFDFCVLKVIFSVSPLIRQDLASFKLLLPRRISIIKSIISQALIRPSLISFCSNSFLRRVSYFLVSTS